MTWQRICELIEEHAGPDLAEEICRAVETELSGVRITVTRRAVLTAEKAHQAAPGRPREAARKLGVAPSTVYRALRRPVSR